MKARAFLLEVLSGVIGVLAWLLGWPGLRTVGTALNLLGLILTGAALLFGIFLLAAIVLSQRKPPYEV